MAGTAGPPPPAPAVLPPLVGLEVHPDSLRYVSLPQTAIKTGLLQVLAYLGASGQSRPAFLSSEGDMATLFMNPWGCGAQLRRKATPRARLCRLRLYQMRD